MLNIEVQFGFMQPNVYFLPMSDVAHVAIFLKKNQVRRPLERNGNRESRSSRLHTQICWNTTLKRQPVRKLCTSTRRFGFQCCGIILIFYFYVQENRCRTLFSWIANFNRRWSSLLVLIFNILAILTRFRVKRSWLLWFRKCNHGITNHGQNICRSVYLYT